MFEKNIIKLRIQHCIRYEVTMPNNFFYVVSKYSQVIEKITKVTKLNEHKIADTKDMLPFLNNGMFLIQTQVIQCCRYV